MSRIAAAHGLVPAKLLSLLKDAVCQVPYFSVGYDFTDMYRDTGRKTS